MANQEVNLQALLQQQMKLMELLTQQMSTASVKSNDQLSVDAICNSITVFSFDPASNVTFNTWFKRYEDIFHIDLAKQDDSWKVRTLLHKLGTTEHDKYVNFILPKVARDFTFDETIKTLTQMFGETTSLFNIRFQCMNLQKKNSEDFVTYAGKVNRECERFQLKSMTDDQFKCLIFICGLQSSVDSEIRTRLLSKIDNESNMTLQKITTECQQLINLKHDTAMIQSAKSQDSSNVHELHSSNPKQKFQKKTKIQVLQNQKYLHHLVGIVESGITLNFVLSRIINAVSVTTLVTKTVIAEIGQKVIFPNKIEKGKTFTAC